MRFERRDFAASKRRALMVTLMTVFRNPFVRLRFALLMGAVIVAIATVGYMSIEHLSPVNALYMAVIVLSGVGLETVKPFDTPTRIFTMIIIVFGLGTVAWVFATIIEVFVSEQTVRLLGRKRMDRKVENLSGHYIVCGFGRLGQQIAQMYSQDNVPFVVIDMEEPRLDMLRNLDHPHVEGDAADDEVLLKAGIERAAALIAVTPVDAVNTFIVLSARGLRPDLFIVARADSHQNEAKLYRAGANKVVSPHILGGRWMGITAINPAVTEFITAMTELDHSRFMLHEFEIENATTFINMRFGDAALRVETGALVIALRHGAPTYEFVPNPANNLVLHEGDTLIAVGSREQLSALAKLVRPADPWSILPKRMRAATVE